MKINPQIAAAAVSRYAQVTGRQAAASPVAPGDRVEISDRAQLFASLLKAARQSDDDATRVHALVNRLASAAPEIDLDRLASRMMGADCPETLESASRAAPAGGEGLSDEA